LSPLQVLLLIGSAALALAGVALGGKISADAEEEVEEEITDRKKTT